ncbi:MAG: hypothetical protein ABIU30_18480 [Ferruginibacter sp.]
MNRQTIITEFTNNIDAFQKLAYNIAGQQDAEDLFQECTLMLLEFDEDRLISYYNPTQGIKPFFIRMLMNQYRSKTSKFHTKYRKQEQFIQSNGADIVHNEQSTELEAFDVPYEEMVKVRDSVHYLNGQLFPSELEDMCFKLYTETGSLRKTLAAIEPQYQHLFDLRTVHEIVKKFRRTIKDYFNIHN